MVSDPAAHGHTCVRPLAVMRVALEGAKHDHPDEPVGAFVAGIEGSREEPHRHGLGKFTSIYPRS